jgi:predicted nucleic acid-binding protein
VGELTALIEGKLIAFDSAPLIYYIEEHPTYLPIADELFAAFDRNIAQGMTSVLTLHEVLVKPFREEKSELAKEYAAILTHSANITLQVIDQDTCKTAAQLRAKHEWLRTPDALQAASAIQNQAQILVTNDDRWRKLTEIEVVLLRTFL